MKGKRPQRIEARIQTWVTLIEIDINEGRLFWAYATLKETAPIWENHDNLALLSPEAQTIWSTVTIR